MSDSSTDHTASSTDADSFDALLAAAVGPPDEPCVGPVRLSPGATIAGRFVVEHHAGEGGMGAVYRCRDRDSASAVALKIVHSLDDRHAGRFKREAAILALLTHSAIVRYVAHGHTEAGLPYLVMEWLDGEDLGQRLRRGRLTPLESMGLVRRCCEGLAVAHARGFVHRDLKPSNIFLPGGDVASAKLLDFGLARGDAPTQTLTRAGTVLGTAGYMAPEQAAGTSTLDPRADLFSLGCVLFECLTGEAAFAGEHGVIVLEKVLRCEVPRASTLCPSVPFELDLLVSSLLEKSRDERPKSALEVARQLQRIEAQVRSAHADEPGPAGLYVPLLATVIVGLPRAASDVSSELAETVALCAERFELRAALPSRGSGLLLLCGDRACPWVDRAVRALGCARAITRRHPEVALSLGSGVVELDGGFARGSAVDRALARREAATAPRGLAVDALTSALLSLRRTVGNSPESAFDVDEPSVDPSASAHEACYGRDKELLLLEATLEECIGDSVSRVVLITGDPGLGKSQLARAFLQRIAARRKPCCLAVRGSFSERAEALSCLTKALGAPSLAPLDPADGELQLTRALLARAAEHERSGLILILDDAQWIDAASLRVIAASLRALGDRPLLVVGFARPDLRDELAALWRSMRPEELRLRPLTDRAAGRLLAALGASSSAVATDQVTALAAGSPRLLAAFGRARVARGNELSALTIALVQELLMNVPTTLLGVLCDASVFGACCWADGVEALQGSSTHVLHALQLLEERKLLVARSTSRFPREREYAFAYPLYRAAAYHLLPRTAKRLAHAHAACWLLGRCEPDDALLIAQRQAARGEDASVAAPARVCT